MSGGEDGYNQDEASFRKGVSHLNYGPKKERIHFDLGRHQDS